MSRIYASILSALFVVLPSSAFAQGFGYWAGQYINGVGNQFAGWGQGIANAGTELVYMGHDAALGIGNVVTYGVTLGNYAYDYDSWSGVQKNYDQAVMGDHSLGNLYYESAKTGGGVFVHGATFNSINVAKGLYHDFNGPIGSNQGMQAYGGTTVQAVLAGVAIRGPGGALQSGVGQVPFAGLFSRGTPACTGAAAEAAGESGTAASVPAPPPPTPTILTGLSRAAQIDYLVEHLPGLTRAQAEVLVKGAQDRGSSAVFGGSRVRGNFRPSSDLDCGFGNLTVSQAGKVIAKAQKLAEEGGLAIEQTRIVPGNETPFISRILTPEEFFQRFGQRAPTDPVQGTYSPSGSITVTIDGRIIYNPPGVIEIAY